MYYKHTKKNFDKYKNRYKYMYFKNEEKLNSCISKQWICSHEILHNGKIPNPILKKIKLKTFLYLLLKFRQICQEGRGILAQIKNFYKRI